MTDVSNRRKHPRIEVGVTGSLYMAAPPTNPVPCQILDISLGGAFIHCTAPIQIGQEIFVEIHFETSTLLSAKVVRDPADASNLAGPAKSIVRWVRGSSKAGFGVEFVGLAEKKRAYLSKLIEHFNTAKS